MLESLEDRLAPTVSITNPGALSNYDGDIVSRAVQYSDTGSNPSFTLSNGPSGLSINSSSGVITGTISTFYVSPLNVTVSLMDMTTMESTSQSFTWNVSQPTVTLTNPGDQTNYVGDVVSVGLIASEDATHVLSYGVSSGVLPSGLSLNTSTGVISGTISSGAQLLMGPNPISLTATDSAAGVSASQTFTWAVTQPTVTLSNPGNQNNFDGDTVSLAVSATEDAGHTLSYSYIGTLPAGLALDPNSGMVTGFISPGASASSPYSITVTATDSPANVNSSTSFTWAVNPVTVTLTRPGDQTSSNGATVNLALTGAVSAGHPLNYTAIGLPAGLTIVSGTHFITGTIAGNADQFGPYTVTLTATDTYANVGDTRTFFWNVGHSTAPPKAFNATFTDAPNQTLTGIDLNPYVRDPNGEALSISVFGTPVNGQLTPESSPGIYDYTPNQGWTGTETLSFEAIRGAVVNNVASLTINVVRLNVGANVNTALLPNGNRSGAGNGNQAETTIAVDPTNPRRLFSASVTYPMYQGIYAAFSTDAGATWTAQTIAMGRAASTDALPRGYADPHAVFDSFGNLYLTYISTKSAQAPLYRGDPSNVTVDAQAGVTTIRDYNGSLWQWGEFAGDSLTVTYTDGTTEWGSVLRNTGTTVTVNRAFTRARISSYAITSQTAHIVVARSGDGGQTFQWLDDITWDGRCDYPMITTGPTNRDGVPAMVWVTYRIVGAAAGAGIYSSWAPVYGNGNIGGFRPVVHVRGTDAGSREPETAIGPTGQMMVAWDEFHGGAAADDIYVSVSTDYRNFNNPRPNNAPVTTTNLNLADGLAIPAQIHRKINTDVGLAWDRSGRNTESTNGIVYLVYTDRPTRVAGAPGEFDTDIHYVCSYNAGVDWGAPVRVHNENNRSQFMPAISVDQTSGYVAVAWLDCSGDLANARPYIFATIIAGAGAQAFPQGGFDRLVSDGQPSDARTLPDPGANFDYGDYMGLAFDGGVFYPAWADNSRGTNDTGNNTTDLDVYTARVTTSQ